MADGLTRSIELQGLTALKKDAFLEPLFSGQDFQQADHFDSMTSRDRLLEMLAFITSNTKRLSVLVPAPVRSQPARSSYAYSSEDAAIAAGLLATNDVATRHACEKRRGKLLGTRRELPASTPGLTLALGG